MKLFELNFLFLLTIRNLHDSKAIFSASIYQDIKE